MDAIVTARVPVETKEQVTAVLREIGSTPTKLINAAYEYVLRERKLPIPERVIPKEVVRVELTPEQREELRASLEAATLPMPQEFWDELGDRSLKEYIADMRQADYEALA